MAGHEQSDRPDGDHGPATEAAAVRLPPEGATPATLLGVSGRAARRLPRASLRAVEAALAPDLVLAVPPDAPQVMPHAGRALESLLLTPTGVSVAVEALPETGVMVVVPPALEDLPASPAAVLETASDVPGTPPGGPDRWRVCLVSDRVSLRVDRHRRETRLDGLEAYAEALGPAWLDGVTHISTALRPGYATTERVPDVGSDDGTTLRLVGVGEGRARLGAAADDDADLVSVDVYPDGVVRSEAVDPAAFGLRGVRGVGTTRAETLRAAGHETVADVAAADPADLAGLSGFSPSAAAEIRARARARTEGTVVPLGDGSVPDGDPVYLDLETDGLSPTTAWLVGVLDGDAADGDYLAFRQRDPEDRRTHLAAFLDWLTGPQRGRPVVAYNGWNFDFPTLRRLVQQHCPEYLEAWEETYKFDPLRWARDGTAALPGRTDRLEDVAGALGWEPRTQGIDGATVARVYVAWEQAVLAAEDPRSVAAPDWDRLEAYCEDDVRALATVYDAVAEAARQQPVTSRPTGSDSTQGSLGDFG